MFQATQSGLQVVIYAGAVLPSSNSNPLYGVREIQGNMVAYDEAVPGHMDTGLLLTSSVAVGKCASDFSQQEMMRKIWVRQMRETTKEELQKQEKTTITEKQVWDNIG